MTKTVYVLFIYLFVYLFIFWKQEQISQFVGDIRIKLQLYLYGTKEQKRLLEIILTISCGLVHKNFVCQNTICLLNSYFKSLVNFMNKTKHGKTTSRNQTTTHKKYHYWNASLSQCYPYSPKTQRLQEADIAADTKDGIWELLQVWMS